MVCEAAGSELPVNLLTIETEVIGLRHAGRFKRANRLPSHKYARMTGTGLLGLIGQMMIFTEKNSYLLALSITNHKEEIPAYEFISIIRMMGWDLCSCCSRGVLPMTDWVSKIIYSQRMPLFDP